MSIVEDARGYHENLKLSALRPGPRGGREGQPPRAQKYQGPSAGAFYCNISPYIYAYLEKKIRQLSSWTRYRALNRLEQFSFLETRTHADGRTGRDSYFPSILWEISYFDHRLPVRVPPDHHGDRDSILGNR
jgi:hypothetical protein